MTLCLMALYLAGISPLIRGMESAGAVLWRQVQPFAQRMLPVDRVDKALGLGMVWGWLPCGMVYAVLLLALSTGTAIQGGLVMLAFGLGTLPNVLLLGGLSRHLRSMLPQGYSRPALPGKHAACVPERHLTGKRSQ